MNKELLKNTILSGKIYFKKMIIYFRFTVRAVIANPKVDRLYLQTDESYKLKIKTNKGEVLATIIGNTYFGVRHGLETLSQLIWWDEYANHEHEVGEKGMLRTLRTASVQDKPMFPYRGLMLDTARNFIPIKDIRRTLDGMASVKLNVFHWHLSDSQSFPIKLPSVPKLAEYGAYSSDAVYQPEEVGSCFNIL